MERQRKSVLKTITIQTNGLLLSEDVNKALNKEKQRVAM